MVEASPQVVITPTTKTEINGMLLKMGTVLSFLEISLCIGVERRIVVETLPIPQTFIMLTSKTQLLFVNLTLIPT